MTQLFLTIFVTVTLWIMSVSESIHLLSPINGEIHKLLKSPERANSKRIDHRYQQSSDPLPVMVIRDKLVTNKASSVKRDGSNLSVIDKFTQKFTDAILSSAELSRIFDTSLSPEEAEEAYLRIVFNCVDNVHSSNPTAVAKTVSNAIRATFDKLPLPKHVQSYGYSAAKFLKSRNVLTDENLNKLLDDYLCYVKQAVNNVPDVPDPRDAFIQAASDGFVHFLTSLNLFTAETVGPISQDYAYALYLLAGVPITPPNCDESNVIEKFTSKFVDTILASENLPDMFTVSFSPEEAEVVYNRVVFNVADNVNACYPRTVSQIVSNAILATYGNLTLTMNVHACGHVAAKYMKFRNVLTCENLNEHCDAFVYHLKQAFSFIPHIPDRRSAFIQAIGDAFVHFLSSIDLFTAESLDSITLDYANTLYFLTGVPRLD